MNLLNLYNECVGNTDLQKFKDSLKLRGIDIRDYPEHRMMLLDYNMIEAKKDDPIAIECRGLILNYEGDIVRKAFDRFFNLGECGVDTFDFEHSIVFEKADGSLMFVYWCPATSKWEIGTRGTAFAEGPHEWFGTFRGFMLRAMNRTEDQFQNDCEHNLAKDVTYAFEAIGHSNRIVTPYKEDMLVYLSSFNNKTQNEEFNTRDIVNLVQSLEWNVRPIRQYRFNSQDDCMIALNALTGLEEGYVAYNTVTKQRVKIKNAVYLAAHRLRGNGLTVNAICELVVMGEQSEYVAVFPEDADKFIPAERMLSAMVTVLTSVYEQSRNIIDQKEFALKVKDLPLSGVMFKARKDKCEINHAFNSYPVVKRVEWLKEHLQSLDQCLAVFVANVS